MRVRLCFASHVFQGASRGDSLRGVPLEEALDEVLRGAAHGGHPRRVGERHPRGPVLLQGLTAVVPDEGRVHLRKAVREMDEG